MIAYAITPLLMVVTAVLSYIAGELIDYLLL